MREIKIMANKLYCSQLGSIGNIAGKVYFDIGYFVYRFNMLQG